MLRQNRKITISNDDKYQLFRWLNTTDFLVSLRGLDALKINYMRVSVTRKNIRFLPDSSRIIARFFMSGELRTQQLIMRVLNLQDDKVNMALEQTLREFANWHRNISRVFLNHAVKIQDIIEGMEINFDELSSERKMLLGAYCTSEYAI